MTEPHVSDLRWDRLLAGELTETDRVEVLAHAEACATCAARRSEITSGFEGFANVAPALPRRVPRRRMVVAVATVVAMAAAVILVVRAPSSETTERTKGGAGPHLMLAAGPRARVAPVVSGDRVQPGDSVQAAYTTTRDGFGAVVARDGSGATSAYVPAEGDAMVALPAGIRRSFPGSTILDEVAGTEVVVIVWCETAHPLAPLIGELRATGNLTAPAGCTVDRVELDVRGAR
jgi:anti-sigma factor RsiW